MCNMDRFGFMYTAVHFRHDCTWTAVLLEASDVAAANDAASSAVSFS